MRYQTIRLGDSQKIGDLTSVSAIDEFLKWFVLKKLACLTHGPLCDLFRLLMRFILELLCDNTITAISRLVELKCLKVSPNCIRTCICI